MGPISINEFTTNKSKGKVMILVIIDVFSKWTQIGPLKNVKSKEVIRKLDKEWIKKWGRPRALLSDQGKQFISEELTSYLTNNDIKHIISSTYNPTGNSVVERANQVIENALKCLKNSNFETAIQDINFSLKSSYHQTLGTTPYEVLLSYA
ncbi:Intracisternal A-particle Pol-related polyprotein [Nosema granulosis]|uniref:Intracisternal A-particle Pol-related polyprotein n=1 Tax=Nosema granulosis TaxID=83296 RepID=A0A9P6KXS9_9MICR|nr:Intracisternal A-particle Pol-related polyprotein [Nosema granulosis]